MTPDEADRLLRGFAYWAAVEPACRALLVAGSWARDAARPESDLDLITLVADPEPWTADAAWLRDLGARLGFPGAALRAESYGALHAWRGRLAPTVELEFGLVPLSWATTQPLDPGTRRVVTDGVRPLVDKDGLLAALQAALAEP